MIFSSGVYPQFSLNEHTDQASLLDALAKIPYHSGSTSTDKALQYVRLNSFNETSGKIHMT